MLSNKERCKANGISFGYGIRFLKIQSYLLN